LVCIKARKKSRGLLRPSIELLFLNFNFCEDRTRFFCIGVIGFNNYTKRVVLEKTKNRFLFYTNLPRVTGAWITDTAESLGLTSQNIMVPKKHRSNLSKKKSPRRDSNPQPPDPKSDALSIAPLGQCCTQCPVEATKIHEKSGTKQVIQKKVIRSRFVRVILAQGPC
jgi:hypothetical protein